MNDTKSQIGSQTALERLEDSGYRVTAGRRQVLDLMASQHEGIAAEDIGFVRRDDPVRVKLDAFPFQNHGTLSGRLTVIGADSVATDPSGSWRQTRAYFPARVTGVAGQLRAVPADMQLAPGMTVSAEIRVGERSVISYFLYPLMKAFDEGIREP